ncbi:Mal regulon transcriptional regulator MalI [Vibrio tapetis subsp. quintayensis]|uniref:Mal regulon transcriptional regulator MalI n=1 Tax=Vibrio tapetis TaxID=52443 RepID=UPI0025B4EC46|nr:Mal regulon transcriptional regulator MalI [Vibrio tapetis]MDN3680099.1 Mal regulon transcriptional regulator MalI [Vibrio tapetis subsp. quintayensis]
MKKKAVKINDVAKHAGVSVSTVSLVLGNKGRISEATIKKVSQAVDELGYVRNEAAANLRTQNSNLIGLILRDITDPFYAEITSGISHVLEKHGYMLFLAQYGDDSEKLTKCVRSMIQQGVAGIAFNPFRGGTSQVIELANNASIPAICLSRATVNDSIDNVCPDNSLAAKMATQHLIEQGHRHIAYVGGTGDSLTRAERIGGYCTTLMQYGLMFKNEWVVECDPSQQDAADVVENLLHHHPQITALLCHRSKTAIGAVYAANRANRRVGKDQYIDKQISIIGFDDVPEAQLCTPPLTFTSSPAYEIGKQAGQRLVSQLKHQQTGIQKIIIPPTLIRRESA